MKLKLLSEGPTKSSWADVPLKDYKLKAIRDGVKKYEGKFYDSIVVRDYKFEAPNYKIQKVDEKKFYTQTYGPQEDDGWSVDLQELKINSLTDVRAIHLMLGDTLVALWTPPAKSVKFLSEPLLVDSEEVRYSSPRVIVWFEKHSSQELELEFSDSKYKSREDETREVIINGVGDSERTLIFDGGDAVFSYPREPIIEYLEEAVSASAD